MAAIFMNMDQVGHIIRFFVCWHFRIVTKKYMYPQEKVIKVEILLLAKKNPFKGTVRQQNKSMTN